MRPRYHYAAIGLLVLAGTCLVLLYAVHIKTAPYIYTSLDTVPSADAAMVLGASVIGTSTLSHVLQERANVAVALYQTGTVKKILVTGDNSALSHNEVDPVGKYLFAHGIPKADIFLDHAGFDTYSSMYRARDVFGARSVIIVSQPFHLPRAIFIARMLGLSAIGFAAGDEPYAFNQIREIPATLKAISDVLLNRTPKYLGESIPLSGTGSSTWPLPSQ